MSIATMLAHSSTQDLEHYVSGKLPPEDSTAVQTHLDGCRDCQLLLAEIAMNVRWKGPERRSEPRVPVNFPAWLKMLDRVTPVSPPHEVAVLEISRNGLRIRTPRFLIPMTLVQVRFNGKRVLGEVRYCIKTEEGYDAGLRRKTDFPGGSS